MRKTMMGLAAGAAVLVMSGEAGACRYAYVNYSTEPYMANFVREAAYIDLARARHVELLPENEQRYSNRVQTHRYYFQPVENLRGGETDQIRIEAGAPFPTQEPGQCSGFDSPEVRSRVLACVIFDRIEDSRLRGRGIAESGHENWLLFSTIHPSYSDGSGGVFDPRASDCTHYQSFELGEHYLIFRDGEGNYLNGWGLNAQLILREDDRWLQAVRYFIENPELDWLHSISAEFALGMFEQAAFVRMETCPNPEMPEVDFENSRAEVLQELRGRADDFLPTNTVDWDFEFAEVARFPSCEPGGEYIFLDSPEPNNGYVSGMVVPLPIHDGVVDLSNLPSQHRIEPSQAPLEDVLSWLSDSEDTNE